MRAYSHIQSQLPTHPFQKQIRMAQPDPLQLANHFHAAADQIALFDNLHAVHEAVTLQRILDSIEQLRADVGQLGGAINLIGSKIEVG